jgi:hypothetical protein
MSTPQACTFGRRDRPPEGILASVQKVLRERAGVDHVTVQVERADAMPCDAGREHE